MWIFLIHINNPSTRACQKATSLDEEGCQNLSSEGFFLSVHLTKLNPHTSVRVRENQSRRQQEKGLEACDIGIRSVKKIHLSIFSSPFASTHKGWSHLADPDISLASKLSVYRGKKKPLLGNGIPSTRRDHYSEHTSGQHCLLWSRGVATATTPCYHAPRYQECSRACFK